MPLVQTSELDVGKAIEYLREKWRGNPCPMCRVVQWSVLPSIYQLPQFNPLGMVVGGSLIPVFPVVCNNCGNTILVNAITAGLLPPTPGMPNPGAKP
jgi:hypothetical protein